jgi:hypothetical protein
MAVDPAEEVRAAVGMADDPAQDGSLAEWRVGVGSPAARRADDTSEVALGMKKLVMGWEGGGAFTLDRTFFVSNAFVEIALETGRREEGARPSLPPRLPPGSAFLKKFVMG